MLRLTALLILCATLPRLAQAEEAICRNGSFAGGSSFGLAKVTGAPRTYLRGDTAPCPDDSAACRGRTYVVPGDTVLTGDKQGRYVCAFYPGKNGGSAGYLRPDEIAPQPAPANPALTAWSGRWADGDDTLTLKSQAGRLSVSGEAFWPSANPSATQAPGGPHLGQISSTAAPTGNTAQFTDKDDDDCKLRLTLLPPYLIASDNMNCGGANVSFTGVYRKK